MKHISIIGAGMAGLLAGNILRKIGHEVAILEGQAALPHNHTALLRFRSSVVGEAVGVPFRKVRVMKWSAPWRNPIADTLSYSMKCSGSMRTDRSITSMEEVSERWIAPSFFIQAMADKLDRMILYGQTWSAPRDLEDGPTISTMPMPVLMKLLKYPGVVPFFGHCHGFNLTIRLHGNVDAYGTIYVPSPDFVFNRVSITGRTMVAEFAFPGADEDEVGEMMKNYQRGTAMVDTALGLFGLEREAMEESHYSRQKYAKILPVDDDARKAFMFWASTRHNIYSLGRFATWRPGLLLDDLPQDIAKISKWIEAGNYDLMRHMLTQ